jgi:hypothetical protein
VDGSSGGWRVERLESTNSGVESKTADDGVETTEESTTTTLPEFTYAAHDTTGMCVCVCNAPRSPAPTPLTELIAWAA